jgi:hypothetical protein
MRDFAPNLAEADIAVTKHNHKKACQLAKLNQQRADAREGGSTETHSCHNSECGKSANQFKRERNGFREGQGPEDSCGNHIVQRVQVCASDGPHANEDNAKGCTKVSHSEAKASLAQKNDKETELIQMKAEQFTGTASCSRNWHNNGAVRNQGGCGQCWTFGTAEQLRTSMIEQHGQDPGKLSTQFLTNCMRKTSCSGGVDGCCGGDPASAVRWIRQQGGIPTQATYGNVFTSDSSLPEFMQRKTKRRLLQTGPVSHSGQGITYAGNNPTHSYSCKTVAKAVMPSDPQRMTSETEMQTHVCNTGTLMIAVDASRWQTYNGGVMAASSCGTSLDHAVLLTGVSQEHNAWVVRNSWGDGWGVSPTDPNQQGTRDQYSNCPQLVSSYGCSANLSGGQTTAQVCQASCPPASGSVTAGYIWLEFGGNTCGLTQSAYSTPSVSLVSGASSTPASSSSSGSSSSTPSPPAPSPPAPSPPPPPPPSSGAGDSCRYANDGACDEPTYCSSGTDCTDCSTCGSSSSPPPPPPAAGGCSDTSDVCSQVSSYCHYISQGYTVRLPGSGTLNDNCRQTCGLC